MKIALVQDYHSNLSEIEMVSSGYIMRLLKNHQSMLNCSVASYSSSLGVCTQSATE